MNLTYREKRIWISLSAQLIVYLIYFVELQRGAVTVNSLVGVIAAIIVLEIALQSLLAITARTEPKDERDLAIERAAFRNAYNVLVLALLGCIALLTVPLFSRTPAHFHLGPFQAINSLLFVLFLAEIAKLATQLVLYRRTA